MRQQMQMQGRNKKDNSHPITFYDSVSDDVDDDADYDDDDKDYDDKDDDDNDYCWQMNVSRGLRGLGEGGQSKKGGKK